VYFAFIGTDEANDVNRLEVWKILCRENVSEGLMQNKNIRDRCESSLFLDGRNSLKFPNV
jgi:hypothetical protein